MTYHIFTDMNKYLHETYFSDKKQINDDTQRLEQTFKYPNIFLQ